MKNLKTKVLVLGVTGMLGNAIFHLLSQEHKFDLYGSIRSSSNVQFSKSQTEKLIVDVDMLADDISLVGLLMEINPDVVINCIGVVKQLKESIDPLYVVPINSLLPHRLAKFCSQVNARLIHISTDCVFSGNAGMYVESDISDANDLYGRTKFIGEVDYPNAITLRTSIIGHEPNKSNRSLVDWFISQRGSVGGYTNAIFSGLPCVELARIIRDIVIPLPHLNGVYHVSSAPISKFELLKMISKVYNLNKSLYPDHSVFIDRSLNSEKFYKATGYKSKSWIDLINYMHEFSINKII
jgi:dTDP-4-dehydrorhamnose reductase